MPTLTTARQVVWEERLEAGSLRLRGETARWSDSGQVHLGQVNGRLGPWRLRARAAQLDPGARRLVAQGFTLVTGGMELRGADVVLDLQSRGIEARAVQLVLAPPGPARDPDPRVGAGGRAPAGGDPR